LPPSEDPFENQPKLPPPPLNVVEAKFPKLALASRSPLSMAFRHIKPGWRNYIEYVDLAARKGDTAMIRYRACYEALAPRDKIHSWPEQLCELADVSPGELVGAVCRAIWEAKAAESSMVSSIAHPEVLMETARLAKKPDNYRDRELFFRLTGSLPDKKGASINIFNAPQAHSGEVSLPDLAQGRTRLKSFDEEIIEMSRDLETPFLVKGEEDVSS
jgi:hypothetical protein